MELDEAQNANHTSHAPQVHSSSVDLTYRLPSLAAAKARCNSMDPDPSRPLPPAGPLASLTPPLHGLSEAVSMEGEPASQHTTKQGRYLDVFDSTYH